MDGRARYKARVGSMHPYADDSRFDHLLAKAQELERLLMEKSNFNSEDITDDSLAPAIEELWDTQVL